MKEKGWRKERRRAEKRGRSDEAKGKNYRRIKLGKNVSEGRMK